jgi:hypothetical protein
MIGKHYRVSEAKKGTLHRHYTVSNCMAEGMYELYLQALREPTSQASAHLKNMTQEQYFSITVKNYFIKEGLSKKLIDNDLTTVYDI